MGSTKRLRRTSRSLSAAHTRAIVRTLDGPPRLRDLPDLLKVDEVAAVLRTGLGKAYMLTRTGALPSVKLGRSLRVPKAALERFLEQGPHDDE